MSEEAHEVQLHAALTALLGRRVTNKQIWDAFGISQSRYYQIIREDSSQLLRADRLIDAARHMGINPAELLVRLGAIEETEAKDYIDQRYRDLAKFQGGGGDSSFAIATRERRIQTVKPPTLARRPDAPSL